MKNFLYKFSFQSGLYENVFYKEIKAIDERNAIIQIIAEFKSWNIVQAREYLNCYFMKKNENSSESNWSIEDFWNDFDRDIFSEDSHEKYSLLNVKEIEFELANT